MMSGANYHVYDLQILESERRLKVSNILSLISNQNVSSTSLQEFIESFSPSDIADSSSEVDLDPYLIAISDLSAIECNFQVLQSLAFIAGYSVHQYLKRSQPCRIIATDTHVPYIFFKYFFFCLLRLCRHEDTRRPKKYRNSYSTKWSFSSKLNECSDNVLDNLVNCHP